MKRIRTLILILSACLVSVAGAETKCKAHTPWTEFVRTNMSRWNPCENVLNVNNVGGLLRRWKYLTGNDVNSSPAVVNGVVYIGSNDGKVYALKAKTGALLWSYTTGGYVQSSPAVANGVVYVGSFDHNVYALDASSGERLWKVVSRKLWKSEYRISPELSHGVSFRPCFVPSS